jgi:tRNA-specific 2-thiouridylase
MIAVLLSGGVDSAAAAIALHSRGEQIMGITMRMGQGLPDDDHIRFARAVCDKLGAKHHAIDIREEFKSVKEYFCSSYLNSETPNPCAICNLKIKFGLMLDKAVKLGADKIATGHYTDMRHENDRYYLCATAWKNSQEYFMALLSQDVLKHCLFPLAELGRPEAEGLIESLGIKIKINPTSQDVCFIKDGHISFIENTTGYKPVPGPIVNLRGKVIGTHKGAVHYTTGQRKGLVTAFGKKVYVLSVDIASNTVTVGDLSDWPHKGFYLRDINFQKVSKLEGELTCHAKVRYKQSPLPAVIKPMCDRIWVEFAGLWAPGQLCAAYDSTGAVLLAGIIDKPTI